MESVVSGFIFLHFVFRSHSLLTGDVSLTLGHGIPELDEVDTYQRCCLPYHPTHCGHWNSMNGPDVYVIFRVHLFSVFTIKRRERIRGLLIVKTLNKCIQRSLVSNLFFDRQSMYLYARRPNQATPTILLYQGVKRKNHVTTHINQRHLGYVFNMTIISLVACEKCPKTPCSCLIRWVYLQHVCLTYMLFKLCLWDRTYFKMSCYISCSV